jgi:plasmid maintenance system antidote protein VapI
LCPGGELGIVDRELIRTSSEIVAGKRVVAANTDLRLCRFFGLSTGYWLRAQAAYDIEVAESALAETLVKIKPWKIRQKPLGIL